MLDSGFRMLSGWWYVESGSRMFSGLVLGGVRVNNALWVGVA